jgi:Icc protein
MSQYAWVTDTHLDFLKGDDQRLIAFAQSLIAQNPTGIFMTGDISTSKHLIYHLSAIERVVQRPIYFVLGNHDYYGGGTEVIRKVMRELSNTSQFLRYMPTMPYYALSPTTAVVGHDGWYDALYGNWQTSNFDLSDWDQIHDFIPGSGNRATIVTTAKKLAFDGVTHVMNGIKKAVKYHQNIVVLTHVPPFAQSHMYAGKQGDTNALPWFTSKMMGDMLMDASKSFPQTQFTVLCGHTHGVWHGKIANNLSVHVGGAEYNQPRSQGLVDVL